MSLVLGLVALVSLFLAFANGANDNLKGVATLIGSRTTDYRRALIWATATTFAGSLIAVWLAAGLVQVFSGKGLVPDALTHDPRFLGAVGLGAASTVMLATRFGFPVSTTHALTGALVGAGFTAAGEVDLTRLGQSFFLPLLLSPALAVAGALILYPLLRFARLRLGVNESSAIALVGEPTEIAIPANLAGPLRAGSNGRVILSESLHTSLSLPSHVAVGQEAVLVRRYQGLVAGVNAQQALDAAHFLSAGAVCLARGLNDAPKIVAMVFATRALPLEAGLTLVAVAMAIGGVIGARRVAETMSHKIAAMNAGQGFTANLVTAVLVVGASRLGVPVSTTHVSCGALFGIGAVNRTARWKTIAQILVAWVTTLPIAAASGALAAVVLGAGRA